MSAEPESSSPQPPDLVPTPPGAPPSAPLAPATPKVEIGPGESIEQSDSAPAPTQEAGLPLSPPLKLPGFENIEPYLAPGDMRTRAFGVFMIREQARLIEELKQKTPFEQKFYEEKQNVAVLQEQLANEKAQNNIKGHGRLVADVWFGLSMAIFGILVCHVEAVPDTPSKIGYCGLAVVVALAGGYTKWVVK